MNEPSVYCGTYAKYNNASIGGAWISLEGIDKESFYDKCKALHSDESDPEFMFQDFENFPIAFYREAGFDNRLWEWLELDENDRTIWEAALQYDSMIEWKDARDHFLGNHESLEDYAWDYLKDTGLLDSMPEFLQRYFDIEAYCRDLELELNVVRFNGTVWIFNY